MEKYLWIGFIGAALALIFALIQRNKVMSYSEGNATMQKIAGSIREGANAYLKHQYTTVAKVFAVVFVILLAMAFATGGEMLSKFTPFAFLTGGIFSMLAAAAILVCRDGFSLTTSFTAALACLSNIGPGLDAVGPMGNFAAFSSLSKWCLSLTMLIGRLEIFPLLILFFPSTWKKT